MITVVMVCFVGFVEEYLFRGILQGTLQQELGRWPGIVLASAVFGLMHSGYGVPAELLFAGVIGFVFGVLYDYLDSLVFVTIVHGVLNVFLFAVYPIKGSFLF
jgi:membrane protease YdiL (CAAX protease family)